MTPFDALADEPRWVAWRIEMRGGKAAKVPYAPKGGRAKAGDPSTWGTRAEAEATARVIVNGHHSGGIGIELGDLGRDMYLAGLDLDSCIGEDGTLAGWAQAILDAVPSYAEVSPSGSGVKLFFYCASDDVRPFLELLGIRNREQWGIKRAVRGNGTDHGPAIEIYFSAGYFTVTGDRWVTRPDALGMLDWSLLSPLAKLIPPARSNGAGRAGGADNSRSAAAFRKGAALRRAGKTFEEMCALLRADSETADWCREKGEGNGGRELRRIWDKAGKASPRAAGTQKTIWLDIGSDVEIAGRVANDLTREFGEVVFADGDFWHYARTHWVALSGPAARKAVHAYDGALYMSPAGELHAVRLSKGRIDSVLHEMGAMLARPDFFANVPIGINCASGFIAFDAAGKPHLSQHDRDHRCRHVLPGHWREGTNTGEVPAGSLLVKLLDGVFRGDEDGAEKQKLVAEIAGSAALGYATKLRQPKAIVLKGDTAENGKSQILDLLRGVLPASAISSITAAHLGDDRFIVGLRAKLLNVSDELSSSTAITSDTFKSVITGEPVSGRDVYRSAITFRPVAQHAFATNTLPTFSGGIDRGVQRRLVVLIFNRLIPVEERIEFIGLRVGQEEPDVLLAWVVAGASRLIRQRDFTIPPSSKVALYDWLFTSDAVLAWTEARVEKRDPNRGGYKSGYAYNRFQRWALDNGYRNTRIPAVNGFVQRLRANLPFIVLKHTNSGNWVQGFEILEDDKPPGN
jgi:putative DNA primase/helicase